MNRRLFLAGGLLAVLPRPAAAMLITIVEEFGGKPQFDPVSAGSLPLVNHAGRVYLLRIDGNFGHADQNCYFRGGPAVAAELLQLFARAEAADRVVRLAAGSGSTTSRDQKKTIAYDFRFHDTRGAFDKSAGRAELTVHITAPVPPPADPGRVKALAADLDSPRYAVRAAADRELAKLGRSARPTLLAERGGGSAEVRSRIDGLLAKLPGLALDDFELPAGVRVVADHLPDAADVHLVPTRPAAPATRTPLEAEIERFVAARSKSSAPEGRR